MGRIRVAARRIWAVGRAVDDAGVVPRASFRVRGARTVPAGRRLTRNIFVFGLLWSVRMCLCLFYT